MGAVIGATAAGIGRGARTVLLLCTVFGLAVMHTLGHAGVRVQDRGPVSMTAMSAVVSVPVVAFVAAAMSGECPDDHCPGDHDHGHGAWSVCLAVLGGLAVVILLAMMLLAVARPGLFPGGLGASQRRASRAPPPTGTGLTLASAAVLRI
ncbi:MULTISPECIES: DUF6153 family protein [unclassified Actinoplanes]|uniref:DUF6153 family protein n=1 Tax=unclassified Actinoplanes TaxID=2626549 RepID=UPI00043A3BC1|nr:MULTISPECIES: DUF6153 family protein [unclassified Actinoplanes]